MDTSRKNQPRETQVIEQMRSALEKSEVREKTRHWYLVWAKQYLAFLKSLDVARSGEADVLRFLEVKSRPGRERWQLAQAVDVYFNYNGQRPDVSLTRLRR